MYSGWLLSLTSQKKIIILLGSEKSYKKMLMGYHFEYMIKKKDENDKCTLADSLEKVLLRIN